MIVQHPIVLVLAMKFMLQYAVVMGKHILMIALLNVVEFLNTQMERVIEVSQSPYTMQLLSYVSL